MVTSRRILILILAAALATLGYIRIAEHADAVRSEENMRAGLEVLRTARTRGNAAATSLFFDQATYSAIPTAYPRPASRWVAARREAHEKVLVAAHYDVLVAPLQVDGEGAFDRATRLLMTAELATAVARSQPGKVADPFLVEQVFGDGVRQYPEAELYRIASLAGVHRIIWGGVGHDRRGHLRVVILSQLRPDGPVDGKWNTPIARQQQNVVAFDEDHSPLEVFSRLLPALLQPLSISVAAEPAERVRASLDLPALPASPRALLADRDNPAREAYTLLLFALLTPSGIERVQERFVAKAMLSIDRLAEDAPEFRALRTRAYAMMHYRGAALAVLGTPADTEQRELAAMLDGNLPEVRAQAALQQNPLKRLLAELDSIRIATDYTVLANGEALRRVKELHLPGEIWPYLVGRAVTDRDPWSQFDNGTLKHVADLELPVAGFSLEDLVRGAASVGDSGKLRSIVDTSVFNHAQRYADGHALHCCDPVSPQDHTLDYMDLLAAMGDDNLIRPISMMTIMQRRNQAALEYAGSIQSIYEGFPYYEVLRGEAGARAAATADGVERDSLMKAAYESVFNAMYWEQSQSTISSRALTDLGSLFHLHEYGYFDNFYYKDVPFHPDYMRWADGGNHETMRADGLAALRDATSEFGAAAELIGLDRARFADPDLVATVLRTIQGRFIGDPARNSLLADQEILRGNVLAAEKLLQENIPLTSGSADSYLSLGKLQLESGRTEDAARTFLAYPGLQDGSGEDELQVVNTAFDMGQLFYAASDYDLATRFLRVAAGKDTGAGSQMDATMRLALLSGNIPEAMQSALARARRYQDAHAYRDYLGILHATQHSRDAWAGFDTLIRDLPEPQIWESALVGHHMAGASEDDVRRWASQARYRDAGNHVSYAVTYLARFATTDRVPSAGLAAAIDALDRPVWQFDTGALSVVRADADGRDQQILGPAGAITPEGILPMGVFEHGGSKHRVRSALSYYVTAYRALKLGDYAEANQVLGEAAGLYDMADSKSSYLLPYFALATVRSGANAATIESILDRMPPADQRFDYQLARATLQAAAGKPTDALQSLKLARYRRPSTDERVALTQFAYADVCEALYQLTGSAAIRKVASDWARSREKAEPWQSWSYALEATLTTDPAARQRAIAMLAYLDPKSPRLAAFGKAEVDAAIRDTARFNPFRLPAVDAGSGTTT